MNQPTIIATLLLLTFALPAWPAGLGLPSVHTVAPAHRANHFAIAAPRPVILSATYQLSPHCSDSTRALTVRLRIRNEGGPLKANVATVRIAALDVLPKVIWNRGHGTNVLPTMAHGQTIVVKQMVGVPSNYRANLPGRHTLVATVGQVGVSGKPIIYPPSPCRFLVTIPAAYCQARPQSRSVRPAGLRPTRERGLWYPPSPCRTEACRPAPTPPGG